MPQVCCTCSSCTYSLDMPTKFTAPNYKKYLFQFGAGNTGMSLLWNKFKWETEVLLFALKVCYIYTDKNMQCHLTMNVNFSHWWIALILSIGILARTITAFYLECHISHLLCPNCVSCSCKSSRYSPEKTIQHNQSLVSYSHWYTSIPYISI